MNVTRRSKSPKLSIDVGLSNAAYGWLMNLLFHPLLSPQRMRRNFDLFAATPLPKVQRKFPNVTFRSSQLRSRDGELRAESITAVPNPTRTMLYLHGGGYVFGSIETYRRRAIKLSYRCRAEVILPEYRLAPEHPFPAALHDAAAAWDHAVDAAGQRPLFIAGDSAGGGLALSLTAYLRDRQRALPAGIVALSPWTDLGLTGESMLTNSETDCWLKRSQLHAWVDWYRASNPVTHPYISPLYADLAGFPPMLLLAGDQEVLLDDTTRLVHKARHAGVAVQTEIGRGMQHDWPLTLPWLKQSKHAWQVIAEFVERIASISSSVKLVYAPVATEASTG
jgi:monoterpene epsilon-lactone hydrolase